MNALQYNDYVLVLLFVKYVFDKYDGQKDALMDVPAGAGFADIVALGEVKEIGDKINMLISRLAKANDAVPDWNRHLGLGDGHKSLIGSSSTQGNRQKKQQKKLREGER